MVSVTFPIPSKTDMELRAHSGVVTAESCHAGHPRPSTFPQPRSRALTATGADTLRDFGRSPKGLDARAGSERPEWGRVRTSPLGPSGSPRVCRFSSPYGLHRQRLGVGWPARSGWAGCASRRCGALRPVLPRRECLRARAVDGLPCGPGPARPGGRVGDLVAGLAAPRRALRVPGPAGVATATAGVAPSTGLVPAGVLASTARGLEVLALTLPDPASPLDLGRRWRPSNTRPPGQTESRPAPTRSPAPG